MMRRRTRWSILAATTAAGILALTLLDTTFAANIILALLAVALWIFVMLYGTFMWTGTSEGKALMATMTVFAGLTTYAVLDRWLPGDLPLNDTIRGVLYLGCLVGVFNFVLLLTGEGW